MKESITKRYKAFTIKDELDPNLAYTNAYVINKSSGKTVSNASDISFDENSNTVLFTASSDFLKNMDLKGEVYELVIEAKVLNNAKDIAKEAKDSVTDSSVVENDNEKDSNTSKDTDSNEADKTIIKNIATSTLDDNPQDTNEVENYLKPTPSAKTPAKNVDSQPAQSTSKMAQTGSHSIIDDIKADLINFLSNLAA